MKEVHSLLIPGKAFILDFSKGREPQIFGEKTSGATTPVKTRLAIIPERGLKLKPKRKALPNIKDKRTFYMKISTEGKYPPCKLMFSYEKEKGSIDIYASLKDKFPNNLNHDTRIVGRRPLMAAVPPNNAQIEVFDIEDPFVYLTIESYEPYAVTVTASFPKLKPRGSKMT